MRLHVLSDLHLEFGMVDIPPAKPDVVVLAGDIHIGREGRIWARNQFRGTPVVYVLGNHEFYRHSLPELTETLKRETDGGDIHLLENNAVEIGGFRFLGCTLWTDFKVSGDQSKSMRVAEEFMSDFHLIRNSQKDRILRARDTVDIHEASVAWLSDELRKGDPSRTIVVTHHTPSCLSDASHHENSPLKPAFTSNLDHIVKSSRAPLWIHGHTHYNVDYKLGETRVLSNQRGYPNEISKGFDPGLVVEV